MIKDLKPPSDLEAMCKDLKCCGRRELSELLKLRYKYNVKIERARKSEKEAKKAAEGEKEMTQEEVEAMVDKQLDETIKRVEREKKRALKKERVLAAKQDVRKKMSVIAATSINNDEELMLDSKTWDKLKALDDAEDVQKYLPKNMPESEDDEHMDPSERKLRFYTDGAMTQGKPLKDEDESSSEDEAYDPVKRVDRMAEEIEDSMRQQRDYQMLKDKKTIKKESKTKALVDLQRQKRQDLSDDEMLANDDIMEKKVKGQDPEASDYSENDDDLEEEREIIKLAKEQAKLKKQQKLEALDNQDDEEEKQLFLNPLLAFKNQNKKTKIDGKTEEDSDVWSDDDKYDPKETKEEKRAKKEKERKLLGKRKRAGLQGDIDDVNAFFKGDALEEVPETEIKRAKGPDDLPDGYSSMDSDEIAETRALAKKMLRKKFRTETVDASYGRYAHDENDDIIPSWF